MKYVVSYKKPEQFWWRRIRNVVGDTILEHNQSVLPMRVLFLADNVRIEIPMDCIIRYSKERFYSIKDQMEQEAGQTLPVKKAGQ